MVVTFPSKANTFTLCSSKFITTFPSSSSSPISLKYCIQKSNENRQLRVAPLWCCNSSYPSASVSVSKRSIVLSLSSAFLLSLAGAEAAVLEAEDDLELLEKVKKDRKKRIEKQVIINSSKKETGYLQDLVYKLSEVGQAIDNNDLNAASSVLGTNTDWIKKANSALSKLSSSVEEKSEVEQFNTSMLKLISSVVKKDVESSKIAFVSSASALEKWTALTGLGYQLKGL